ncbi:MAG: hypothetical protein RL885_30415 [Planctomycetota bacterium]
MNADRSELDALVDRFLSAEPRERKKLLKEVVPAADRAAAERLAPVIRDPSPRVAARVTSLLARHALDEVFERQLEGLKPGKVDILRSHYRKIRSEGEEEAG